MAITFTNTPSSIPINDVTPGATTTFEIDVRVDQPPASGQGSLTVNFEGQTASAPLNFAFNNDPIVPDVVVDPGTATRISLSAGTPVLAPGSSTVWKVPITATVL